MKYLIYPAIVLLLMVSLYTCTKEERENIKEFYYPIESLINPKVYEYQSLRDSLAPEYWYFRTMKTDTATYFTANLYNSYFEVEQFSLEEIVTSGVLQKEYYLTTLLTEIMPKW